MVRQSWKVERVNSMSCFFSNQVWYALRARSGRISEVSLRNGCASLAWWSLERNAKSCRTASLRESTHASPSLEKLLRKKSIRFTSSWTRSATLPMTLCLAQRTKRMMRRGNTCSIFRKKAWSLSAWVPEQTSFPFWGELQPLNRSMSRVAWKCFHSPSLINPPFSDSFPPTRRTWISS